VFHDSPCVCRDSWTGFSLEIESLCREISSPYCEISSPYREIASPYREMASPYCEMSSPHCEISSPYRKIASPSCEMSSPYCEMSFSYFERPQTRLVRKIASRNQSIYVCVVSRGGSKICRKPTTYVFHDSFMCVPWLIYVRDMTPLCVCYD